MVGNSLRSYIDDHDSLAVVAGVVEDFYIGSVENKAIPAIIKYKDKTKQLINIYIRTQKGETKNVVKSLKQAWAQAYPDDSFMYGDVYANMVGVNSKIFEMSRLLDMYSLISILLTCFGLFGITFMPGGSEPKKRNRK